MSPAKAQGKPPKRPTAKDADQAKPAPKISHADAVAARDAIWNKAEALFRKGWQ